MSTSTRDALCAAAETRLGQTRQEPRGELYKDWDEENPRRQQLRRMIDKGIIERNGRDPAIASMQTIKKLAQNILKEPENLERQRVKRTNDAVRRKIIEPKGALEFIMELGFREKVEDFTPYLIFQKQSLPDLKLGLTLLEEALERELPKKEAEQRALENAKRAEEEAKEKALLRIKDDRQKVKQRVAREAAARHSRFSVPPEESATPGSPSTVKPVSRGYTLDGRIV
ncbi:uncharacterized protein LAESUDRAFT_750466 [Laetiporus sulphureus 93-53]|uniref:PUB domain-containing protein n=1 Tax=Laetiporus sulphureus 93-53 TaxID=1314785 RepID=A0A165DS19_9APHY|nr:uncharacterized protein LAESUDRAFT_750466 [Laetiporus sulphureus 93-53]KZT05513.1 hypothetical protein LAESUDRAFT_750466 [Laetiporus sulphureus 93-53]